MTYSEAEVPKNLNFLFERMIFVYLNCTECSELCLYNNKLKYLPSMLLPDFTDWQTIRIIDIQVLS
jgi:hypothetical protein